MSLATSVVTGVDFVTLPTRDLAAAQEFYGTVLGLRRSSVYQRGDTPAIGAEFETGSLTLSIVNSEAVNLKYRPNDHPIAFHVNDVEAARGALEARGVTFGAETLDTGVCHMAFSRTPTATRSCSTTAMRHARLMTDEQRRINDAKAG